MNSMSASHKKVVGIVAPAYGLSLETIERGIKCVEAWGFRTRSFLPDGEGFGKLANDDQLRSSALRAAVEDKEVTFILAIRGGYGCTRLLPTLDPSLIRRSGKTLIGYSDLTALLLYFDQHGAKAIHGPMLEDIAGGLAEDSEVALRALLDGDLDLYCRALQKATASATISVEGSIEAPIVGGNLSLLLSLLGTDYFPDLKGCIVFIEDCDEPHYRIDRMLTQVTQCRWFNDIAGLIVGDFTNISGLGVDVPTLPGQRMCELSQDRIPILTNFPSGHGPIKFPWPIRGRLIIGDGPPRLTSYHGTTEKPRS